MAESVSPVVPHGPRDVHPVPNELLDMNRPVPPILDPKRALQPTKLSAEAHQTSIPTLERFQDHTKTKSGGDKEFFLDQFELIDQELLASTNSVHNSSKVEMSSSNNLMVHIPFKTQNKARYSSFKQNFVPSSEHFSSIKDLNSSSLVVHIPFKNQSDSATSMEMSASKFLNESGDRTEFFQGRRSASQQAELELAVQMNWNRNVAAGHLHSMINCSSFQTDISDGGGRSAPQRTTKSGRSCCSHPECTKQVQYKGKCFAHGGVRRCSHPDCTSNVGAGRGGFCFQHGGRPICSEEDCKKAVVRGGKCSEHGGTSKVCSFPDCTTRVQRRGLCAAHGGVYICKTTGCDQRAVGKGLCRDHGGGTKCKSEGCEKYSQKHGYCYRHAVENGLVTASRKGKCKVDGCVKYRLRQGYCSRHAQEHGLTVGRKCKTEGCEKSAQSGGFCTGHGGGRRCQLEGCTKTVVSKGLCAAHGGRITCNVAGCENWGLSSGDFKGYCVKHGGGRRCKEPGCNKSVQTRGFCSVHSWYKCQEDECEQRIKTEGYCVNHAPTGSTGSVEKNRRKTTRKARTSTNS